jgi:hypothetical protein
MELKKRKQELKKRKQELKKKDNNGLKSLPL